jgi:hypothetical protein
VDSVKCIIHPADGKTAEKHFPAQSIFNRLPGSMKTFHLKEYKDAQTKTHLLLPADTGL